VDNFVMQLPVSLNSFEKKTVASKGWGNIFSKIRPFSEADEKLIIDSLLAEIHAKFAISISKTVSYDRLVPEAATGDAVEAIILVGASHARNLSPHLSALGFHVEYVEMPSWKPNSLTVTTALADLERLLRDTPHVAAVVYTCLDGAAFCAMTDDSIIPISRDSSGAYHVYGQLVGAPPDMFTKAVKTCVPLFSCSPSTKKFILSPLPRYWQERCCTDDDHVSNLGDPSFEDTIFSCIDSQRRIIKDVLHTSGVRSCTTLNFGQLCTTEPGSKVTNDDIKNALAVMWSSDPVHPSEDAYATVAINLNALLMPANPLPSPQQSPASERPQKRPKWLQDDSCGTVTPRGGGNFGRGLPRGRGGPRGRFWARGGRGRF
jgi:hypothetical protein